MKDQMNLFDYKKPGHKSKPYDYSFNRYIGQKVKFWITGEVGKIIEIGPYYTSVLCDHVVMAGTPTTICPVEDKK